MVMLEKSREKEKGPGSRNASRALTVKDAAEDLDDLHSIRHSPAPGAVDPVTATHATLRQKQDVPILARAEVRVY